MIECYHMLYVKGGKLQLEPHPSQGSNSGMHVPVQLENILVYPEMVLPGQTLQVQEVEKPKSRSSTKI